VEYVENYVVRIYRREKNNPCSFIGVVEEVGVEEKKAFSNLEELWQILNSIKGEVKQYGREVLFKAEKEKRREERTRMRIPLVPLLGRHKLKAYIENYSQGGLGICTDKKVALKVGNVFTVNIKNRTARVETRWVNDAAHSSFTMAGLRIIEGNLDLKGSGEDKDVSI
jgi:hypothetical protein